MGGKVASRSDQMPAVGRTNFDKDEVTLINSKHIAASAAVVSDCFCGSDFGESGAGNKGRLPAGGAIQAQRRIINRSASCNNMPVIADACGIGSGIDHDNVA